MSVRPRPLPNSQSRPALIVCIVPEWVSYHKKGYVLCACIAENLVALQLDHLAVSDHYGAALVALLLFY